MEHEELTQVHDAPAGAQENVFSRRVRAGKRTYFFDVKATKSVRDFYVVITESRRVSEEKYEKHKIFLYKEDFAKFAEALGEATSFVESELGGKGPTPA